MPRDEDIFEANLGEGDHAYAVMLPVEPHGETVCMAPDNSADSKTLLEELCSHWYTLWPVILEKLEYGIADTGLEEQTVAEGEFIATVSRTQKGYFMADQADIYLSLEFEGPPQWDCFIKGDQLVHFQPVF